MLRPLLRSLPKSMPKPMPTRHNRPPRHAGMSLIEALVALAMMAFGTVSVLGLQSSLRLQADLARQHSEALRIGQAEIESLRGLDTLAAFDALSSEAPTAVAEPVGSTTYLVTRTIAPAPAGRNHITAGRALEQARYKSITMTVAWTDRSGQAQSVALHSAVHGALPVLAGSLAVPGERAPLHQPGGRHRSIPPLAIDQGDGTSLLMPPGASVRWTFDNTTGHITRLCDTCEPVNARLLSGYVRFALDASAPGAVDAERPSSAAFAVSVRVLQSAPAGVPAPTCHSHTEPAYVMYHCAVQTLEDGLWSGRSTLEGAALVWSNGAEPDRHRVCRYTALMGEPPVPSTRNLDHPDTYTDVSNALRDQNFLVIRAGDGSDPFACPGDDASTRHVNGQTWPHPP